ncbi:hypothetical protein LOTGIDRAFT_238650 [Lottia gigantea]|uniref:Glutamate receptor n=1 Tax=Lottia gigantea TaxID=225164 RepID=V4ASF8_LOTGI|nr:hypothetical protein LOTGIDRAFT_238650 [Lottia gigantea]ESP00208.1 hypothetical protein LOTGIDRAFT_238650 [Lottia gigantea]
MSLLVDAALSIDGVDTISKALKLMIQRQERVFQYTFRRSEVFNYNRTKGIPCISPPIPWMHGKDIYESIKRVKFEGLTGNLAFDERGYRKDYRLDVLTVSLNNGPEKIGEWDSNTGLKSVYDEEEDSGDTWNYTRTDYERTVVSIISPPFLYRNNKTDNGRPPTGNDRYEGYCKDLADALARELGLSYRMVIVKDNKYGVELENKSWNGIIGELRRGRADLAVAPLTITAERERVVDFSKPFMNVGISIMIRKPEKQKPGVFSFMEPFTINIWACITIAYVLVSVSIYMASRFSPYEWSTEDLTSGHIYHNQFTLPNAFWFSMGALMLQGSDHVCPRSTAGRIIGGAWWFFVLITISSYTANLAAFLTIERMLTPIDSADALAKQTDIAYGTVEDGSTKSFFKKSKVTTYKNMWNYMSTASPPVFTKSIQEGVERVRNTKGKYAFLLESSNNDFYNNRKPCNTMRVGPNLDLKGFGIATPLNSHLKEAINYVVLKLKEDGTLHKLQQTWWFEKGECGTNPGHRESKKRSLSLSNVSGIFYILISGLVLAIIIGLIEIYYGKRHPPKLVHYSYSRRWQNSRPNLGVTSREHHNGLFVEAMIK